ncbi:MAG: patatin-like phospholipase family protein [Pseudomonadota bacterium]
MGITIVQKSDLKAGAAKRKALKALVLAGGAVSGGSFMAGGIRALSSYFDDFRVRDFDIFVGISSGSMLAVPLSAGISPESLLRTLDGTSSHFTPLKPWHYYRPNVEEFLYRPLSFIFKVGSLIPQLLVKLTEDKKSKSMGTKVVNFLQEPSVGSYHEMVEPLLSAVDEAGFPSIFSLFPTGIFDNRPLEEYFRKNIERNNLTNDFKKAFQLTKKRLYICAMTLDGAKRVVFGPDEVNDITISEAIQASTALPGFYRPARIRGVDYVDGGVQESANIDVAVDKGAGLIICYNPFRPYDANEFVDKFRFKAEKGKRMSERGLLSVINQIFRAIYHSRLEVALDRFKRDPKFTGDIMLIEPKPDDVDFFMLNPLSLSTRVKAAKYGYISVKNSIEEKFDEMKKILSSYGIKISRRRVAKESDIFEKIQDTERVREVLEGKKSRSSSSRK